MNKHFKTKGIIIRKVDFNEADRIVTLLTDDLGKTDCIAKGARRIKSKFCGRLELFYEIEITCFQGRELAICNEVQLIGGFTDTKDVNKHRILFYIAELTNRIIQRGQQIEGSYPLLSDALQHLGHGEKPEVVLHSYLIKLLTLTGFLSPWNKCAICNEKLNLESLISLSAENNNIVCYDCACSGDRIITVPIIKWINFMQNYPITDALKIKVEKCDHETVWLWLQKVLGDLLVSPVKSEEFLKAGV